MSTTSTGSIQGFSTSTYSISNLSQERASFTTIDAAGEVTSITLNGDDSYDVYFYYRETGASSFTEVLAAEGVTSTGTFVQKLSGLLQGTDYEYYISVNQSDGLQSSPESAQTATDATDQNSGNFTTTALPVTTIGTTDMTRTSLVFQGEVEDTADLEPADSYDATFRYRESGQTSFTDVDLGTFSDPQVFEEEVTGLAEDQAFEIVFRANGVEGLILERRTPTDETSTGDEPAFRTLAYQEILTPQHGRSQAKRDLVVEYDLNIDVQGEHQFIYDRNGTDEVLNTVQTPEPSTQTVTIPDVDRDGDTKTYTLTFTDESGGSGPGDLSRSRTFTVDIVDVKKLTGDEQTFTVT